MRITGIADAGIDLKRRLIFRHIENRLRHLVIHQYGSGGCHGGDQVKLFQLRQRERTVADHFIQHHALARFQPGVLITRNRLHHHLHMAGKHATLVVLVAQLQTCFRRAALNLAVCLRHHLCQTAFQLFPGIPGSTRPDHA